MTDQQHRNLVTGLPARTPLRMGTDKWRKFQRIPDIETGSVRPVCALSRFRQFLGQMFSGGVLGRRGDLNPWPSDGQVKQGRML